MNPDQHRSVSFPLTVQLSLPSFYALTSPWTVQPVSPLVQLGSALKAIGINQNLVDELNSGFSKFPDNPGYVGVRIFNAIREEFFRLSPSRSEPPQSKVSLELIKLLHRSIFIMKRIQALVAEGRERFAPEVPSLKVDAPAHQCVVAKLLVPREPGQAISDQQSYEWWNGYLKRIPPTTHQLLHSYYTFERQEDQTWALVIRNNAWLERSNPVYPVLQELFEREPLVQIALTSQQKAPSLTTSQDLFADLGAIPLVRGDSTYVYVIDTAYSAPFGALPSHRARINALQAAITKGLICGATIEVTGSISPDFLTWVVGSDVSDHGPVPDVQIIYSLPLPSGNEFRFAVKRGTAGLVVSNAFDQFSPEDLHIIKGVRRSILERTLPAHLSRLDPSDFPELQRYIIQCGWAADTIATVLGNPQWLGSNVGIEIYYRERLAALHKVFAAVADSTPRRQPKRDVFSLSAYPSGIARISRKFQEEVTAGLGPVTGSSLYLLNPDQESAVIRETLKRIKNIRSFERARRISEGIVGTPEHSAMMKRALLGCPEVFKGVALDVGRILQDVIIATNGPGRGAVRDWSTMTRFSYDHPDRFGSVKDIPRHLKGMDRERFVRIDTFDPLSGTYKSYPLEHVTGPERVMKVYSEIAAINRPRIRERFDQWRAGLSSASRAEWDAWLARREGEISRAIVQLDEDWRLNHASSPGRSRQPDGNLTRDEASYSYRVKRTELQDQLYAEMLNAFGSRAQFQTFGVRIVRVVDQEVARFIYVVNWDCSTTISTEGYRKLSPDRTATHSELGRGRNVFGAGDLIFERHNKTFNSLLEWQDWVNSYKDRFGGPWRFVSITDGSGHYGPYADLLPFASRVVVSELKGADFDPQILVIPEGGPRLTDALLPGVGLSVLS